MEFYCFQKSRAEGFQGKLHEKTQADKPADVRVREWFGASQEKEKEESRRRLICLCLDTLQIQVF